MDGNELKDDPPDEGESQDEENWHEGPQGPTLPGKTGQSQEGKEEPELGAQAFPLTLPVKINLGETDGAYNLQKEGSQDDKFESDFSDGEFQPQIVDTMESQKENYHKAKGKHQFIVTNLEDGEIIIDLEKDVIKTPPRPSEAEKAAGGGDTGNDITNNSAKSSIGGNESLANRTAREITNLEKKPKSFQQKASSDREFETPTPKLWKRSSRVVKADDNTRERKDIKENEIVVLQNKTDTEDEGEKGLKKRRMSPEEKEEKTEEYYERQKLKEKEDTPPRQCACGGTALKHKYLLHAEDYTKKYMCVGTILDTVKEYGIILITEKEYHRIQKVIETNEKFNSKYCTENNQMEIVENKATNEVQNDNKLQKQKPAQPKIRVDIIKFKQKGKRKNRKKEREKLKELRKKSWKNPIRKKQNKREKEKVKKIVKKPYFSKILERSRTIDKGKHRLQKSKRGKER
ncbi:hypothetical protein JTB14_018399 [Gonioctena quinquepunctata]|nr:hypothetical protein JTB14_018399 [Gonioctena quinquepunctata]